MGPDPNILTHDVDGTCAFYATVLGLERGESAGARMGYKGAWMFDESGHPLVHIGFKDPERDYGPGHEPGAMTGAFHHVAFRCSGFTEAQARLKAAGLDYRVLESTEFDLRQISLKDPNNINVELNFPKG